jgi:hypothetical protein
MVVIASPTGVVSQLNTEDSKAGSGIDAAVAGFNGSFQLRG